MSVKPIRLRGRAHWDVTAATAHYFGESSVATALGFIDVLQNAYNAIAKRPAAGSPRYGHEVNLPGVRSQSLKRFPYLVFYIEQSDHIDVWRVLDTSGDIPASLVTPQG